MIELRKDYILDRYVIISRGRKKRPKEFDACEKPKKLKTCFFCPGNEHTTPPEIGRVEYKNSWKVRWFPNLFPLVEKSKRPKTINRKYFWQRPAYGMHEVIVESPDHSKQLADLDIDHIADVLKVYALRIKDLSKDGKYVVIFKNYGKDAGTSLVHSHTQACSVNILPKNVEEKVQAIKQYKTCPYCDIIKKEQNSKRKIFENKEFVSFAPFASRFNYEAWIFPKKHCRNITEMDDTQLTSLAQMLKKILMRLQSIDASYNMILHYAPKGTDLHFHIEIMPRIAKWAGFELNTGIIVNSVPPETAAQFYRKRS